MSGSPRAMARSKAVFAVKPGAPVPRRRRLAHGVTATTDHGKHQSAETVFRRMI